MCYPYKKENAAIALITTSYKWFIVTPERLELSTQ